MAAKEAAQEALNGQREHGSSDGDSEGKNAVLAQHEVELAALETRMQEQTLELIQPTIRKQTELEEELKLLQGESQRTNTMVNQLIRSAVNVQQQVALIETFREEMAKWDFERQQSNAKAAENISMMKQELDTFRYGLEREDTSVHGVQRTVDRVVGELERVQETADMLRQHMDTRLSQQAKVLNSAKTDLEVKLIALETRCNRMGDELWGEETGLAKAVADLESLSKLVTSHSDEMWRMQTEKADVVQLESVQDEVTELLSKSNGDISALKNTVDTMMTDVRDHFRTATNTVAAHNAIMLTEIREEYQKELERSSKMRSEIQEFVKSSTSRISQVQTGFGNLQDNTETTLTKLQADIDELVRRRKLDRGNADLESQQLREQLHAVQSTAEAVSHSTGHLKSIVGIILRAERQSSALDMQDDNDRANIALMGLGEAKKEKAPSTGKQATSTCSTTASSPVHGGRRSKAGSVAGDDHEDHRASSAPVISLDNRCMSCSGQARTLVSGFKMACLQYMPGPVHFDQVTWRRGELIGERERLLEQAVGMLSHGPSSMAATQKEVGNLAGFGGRHAETSNVHVKWDRNTSRTSSATPQDSPAGSSGLPPLSFAGDEDEGAASRRGSLSRSDGFTNAMLKMPRLSAR